MNISLFNISLCATSGVKMDKTEKNEFQCLSFSGHNIVVFLS